MKQRDDRPTSMERIPVEEYNRWKKSHYDQGVRDGEAAERRRIRRELVAALRGDTRVWIYRAGIEAAIKRVTRRPR